MFACLEFIPNLRVGLFSGTFKHRENRLMAMHPHFKEIGCHQPLPEYHIMYREVKKIDESDNVVRL